MLKPFSVSPFFASLSLFGIFSVFVSLRSILNKVNFFSIIKKTSCKGKWVIVTDISNHIGKAALDYLAEIGYNIIIFNYLAENEIARYKEKFNISIKQILINNQKNKIKSLLNSESSNLKIDFLVITNIKLVTLRLDQYPESDLKSLIKKLLKEPKSILKWFMETNKSKKLPSKILCFISSTKNGLWPFSTVVSSVSSYWEELLRNINQDPLFKCSCCIFGNIPYDTRDNEVDLEVQASKFVSKAIELTGQKFKFYGHWKQYLEKQIFSMKIMKEYRCIYSAKNIK